MNTQQTDRIKVRLPWQFLAEIEGSITDHYDITEGDEDTMAWVEVCRLITDDGVRANKRGDVDVMVTVDQVLLLMWEAEDQAAMCDPECGYKGKEARGRMLTRFAERLAQEVAK